MNVSLTPQLEKLIQDKLKSGLYHSASEVIRDGLRLLEERDQLRDVQRAALRKAIAVGIEQAERGDVAPLDVNTVKAKGRERRKAGR
jgi:antitoxin ParD1/3/4